MPPAPQLASARAVCLALFCRQRKNSPHTWSCLCSQVSFSAAPSISACPYFCLPSPLCGENIILFSCCRLFKSSSRGEELGREALRETWSRSAALLSSTPEALLFHLVLPRFSCIQTYTLLFIYTIVGFKNNVNLPVGTCAVPARNRGQKGQSHRR